MNLACILFVTSPASRALTVAAAVAAIALTLAPSLAIAGSEDSAFGVGIETDGGGRTRALAITSNKPTYHLGGVLGFSDLSSTEVDTSSITLGGRGYYHVHSMGNKADFGIGGGLYLRKTSLDLPGDDDDTTEIIVDLGFQIRAFVTDNVALSFTGGLNVGAADADDIYLGGQLTGAAGVHYFF